jgi:hypothetical protein|tara:strand:+ start:866 stop:1030 length:165 start_codon:yes stop_codon:yes gene_type:complete
MDYALYDTLINDGIATEEEVRLVATINGDSVETYESILYVRTGYRSLEQYQEED